jgi:drug/metabolite transporter (DMT)-like permease
VIGSFAFMSLIWGATWLAMKLGVATVPPIFFGGTRFLVAGLLLLLLAMVRGETRRFNRRELGRLLLVQLLIVVLTYAPLFWGILYVPSGLTAVLDLTLMPVSLIGFGIALGEESWSFGRAMALGFGFAGLAVLFGPQAVMPTDLLGLLGAVAIVFSALVYSLGSVVARPLTKTTNATFLSGVTMLPGGLILTLGAWAFEPGARAAAWFNWSPVAWSSWLFLVVFGSLVAFTTYMRLIAAWGPARAGSYAYVSPVIAVLLGIALLHEHFELRDAIGMTLLLVAAFCSLRASISNPPDQKAAGSAHAGDPVALGTQRISNGVTAHSVTPSVVRNS